MPAKSKASAARPAETATGTAAAVAVLVAAIFDIQDRQLLLAIPVLIAAVPSLVTYCVTFAEARKA